MNEYMIDKLNLPREEVLKLRHHYYQTYGTTLRGLQRHHQVDTDEYLNFVHNLPLEDYLRPNPELRTLILSLPQKRWIFTNADADHAARVLSILGLSDCFNGIIDVRAIEFACKPEEIAYQRALALAGGPAPAECLMLDDSIDNLTTAHKLGFGTLWINTNGVPPPAGIHQMHSLMDLPQAMPNLWDKPHDKPSPDHLPTETTA
jgi:pyrimidine 5'-nucleotidase